MSLVIKTTFRSRHLRKDILDILFFLEPIFMSVMLYVFQFLRITIAFPSTGIFAQLIPIVCVVHLFYHT